MSCSCFGTGACLSTNVGTRFTDDRFQKVWLTQVQKGQASSIWGGYVLNMMCEWKDDHNNKCPDDKVYFVRTNIGSDEFFKILDKGYRIATGYNNHIGFNEDWQNDGVVDRNYNNYVDNEDWGESYGGGHCISITKTNNYKVKGCEYVVVDNYVDTKGREKNNIYGIKKELINELVNRGILFNYGYFFVFENDIPKKAIDTKLVERCKGKIVMITDTKDGTKASGEQFYCNFKGELFTLNGTNSTTRNAMAEDNKNTDLIKGIYKEDLENFHRINK